MTREEEINYASKDYVNYILDKQEYHNENYTEDDIRQAFVKGAMFADKNPELSSLWHDTNDIPNDDSLIIYESMYGDILLKRFTNRASAMANVLRWTYVNDLLPKGSEI